MMKGRKSVKEVLKYQKGILSILEKEKDYVKFDDIMIDLLVPYKAFNVNFDRAWRELLLLNYIEICGNSIKLKT